MQPAELDELRPRRGLRIGIVVAVLIAVAVAVFFLRGAFAGESKEEESYQPYTVGTMTLRAMVTTSGIAVAQDEAVLSFAMPGQIEKIHVQLGDTVKSGQPLISLKSEELQNITVTAQSAVTLAELRLKKLREGATSTEMERAEEAVTTALSALTKAENDLSDGLDSATDAQLSAARERVASAEAGLAAAQAKLNTLLNGASDADTALAESNLTQADIKLSQAERTRDDAEASMNDAQSGFETLGEDYCETDGHVESACAFMESANYQEPLSSDLVDEISDAVQSEPTPTRTPGPSPTPTETATPYPTDVPTPTRTPRPTPVPLDDLEQASLYLVNANTAYRQSITTYENTVDSVTAAESVLVAAQAALDELSDGAKPEDITAAEEAVESAEEALTAAQATLQEVLDGATDTQLSNLYAAVARAEAGLRAATTARDELAGGATATEIAMQQEEVHQAELALAKANIALDESTLVSPFDGVVSSLPIKIGQVVNASIPAVTILTPGTLILELNIGETELPSLRTGQVGGVMFDAIQGKIFPLQVYAIGLSPEQQQGIVIYKVRCKLLESTAGAGGPQPGMSGSASIIVEQKANVVAIPSAAIRSRASEKVVEVIVDGKIETRAVQTGLSDGDNIEITSGLSVGDVIAMRGAGGSQKDKAEEDLPEGIR